VKRTIYAIGVVLLLGALIAQSVWGAERRIDDVLIAFEGSLAGGITMR
jgi:hypothetical protein